MIVEDTKTVSNILHGPIQAFLPSTTIHWFALFSLSFLVKNFTPCFIHTELCLICSYLLRVYKAKQLVGKQHDWIEGLWYHDRSRKCQPDSVFILGKFHRGAYSQRAGYSQLGLQKVEQGPGTTMKRWDDAAGLMKKLLQFTQSQQLTHITSFIIFYFIL